MRRVVILFILLVSSFIVRGQERGCATVELEKLNKSDSKVYEERQQFEQWLKEQIVKDHNKNALEGLDEEVVYQVPVVVHVIHKGEPLGVGTNIPEAQVMAQIEALNLDFRHLNADSVNTPAEFTSLMADISLEFVLAKQDPLGFSTDGINRVNGGNVEWNLSLNTELKSLSYWPSEDYLNIWVADLESPWLGWAEYPTSTIIDGVNNLALDNRLTDGVVVTTKAFGSQDLYPAGNYLSTYNQGRTLTHEMGHFFGLRHIWGDGNCSVDDYVSDTPLTDGSYGGCPNLGQGFEHSCNNNELSMFMNYMDYVFDECMNLFTLEQKERMQIVLNNSPRRASLLTSPALNPPPPLDLAMVEIQSPGNGTCTNSLSPSILVQNLGTTRINNIELGVYISGSEVQSKFFNLSLQPDDQTVLIPDEVILPDFGLYQVDFAILSVNGGTDDNQENNLLSKQVNFSRTVTGLGETFATWPENWAVRSEAPLTQWNISRAPNISIQNTSAVLNYYQNGNSNDQLISPNLDLTGRGSAFLLFDVAYVNSTNEMDELYVVISTDCGNSFPDTLFSNLQSSRAEALPVSFSPAGPVDWQTHALDLSAYLGQSVQVAFLGNSLGSNNIYLDNIILEEEAYADLAIRGLVNETGVFTGTNNTVKLWVENTGVMTINNLDLTIKANGNTIHTQSFSNVNMSSGAKAPLAISYQLSPVTELLTFEINTDDNLENNTLISSIKYINNADFIPFRGYFNSPDWNLTDLWTIRSPGDELEWTQTENFIGIKSYEVGNKGLHDWLVLPPFDFSRAMEVGLRFKLAYADNIAQAEMLRVWASTNNGASFDHLVSTYAGNELLTGPSVIDFVPDGDTDWQTEFIDLSAFAGEESVLLAFEVTDGDGGNLYLDDIDVFVSANAEVIELEPGKMATYPNPVTDYYGKLTFSLDKKQDIRVRIIDLQGNTVSDQVFTDVINQTYPLELSSERNGLYIIQAVGDSFRATTRLVLNR